MQTPEATPSEWLSENIPRLAEKITTTHFSRHPVLLERYGPRGKQKCLEDAAYHLHYLAEAVAVNSTSSFIDYIGWGKIMLASRGIEVKDLENSLITMADVLRREAGALNTDVFDTYINLALAALPGLPDTLPTFVNPRAPFSDIANSYLNSLLVLNRDEAITGAVKKVNEGLSITDLFHHVLFPVQQEVGRLWQQNQITVVQEHYCTAATNLLVVKLRRGFIGTPRQVSALTVCAEGEEHCLGLKMLSELLESDGWRVAYLEGKPASDVLDYLQSHFIDVVAISAGTAMNLSKIRRLIAEIKALAKGPRVLIGGRAVAADPNIWQNLGADAFAASLIDGLEAANRLAG